MDGEDAFLGAGISIIIALIIGGVYFVATTQPTPPVVWSCQSVNSVQFLNSGFGTEAKTVVYCADGSNMVFCDIHPNTFVVGKPISIEYRPYLASGCYFLA